MKELQAEGLATWTSANVLDPLLRRLEPRETPVVRSRARVRVVFNQKGGVGKTTISVNLATCAALVGQRTLLVDSDPSGNSTTHLVDPAHGPTRALADFYEGCVGLGLFRQSLGDFVTAKTRVPGLHLVAGDRRLEDLRSKLESRHKINRLRDGMSELDYDQVFFDTPPALDFFSLSCLIAAHELIIPVDCDAFSVEAARQVRKAVEEVRQDHNPRLAIAGVVVNQYQRSTRHAARVVAELRRLGFNVLEPFIPTSVKVRESHSEGTPISLGQANHPVAVAVRGVYEAIAR
jgi:chromosome partitioning protein